MAVTTLVGHVSRALDFYNKDSIFFVIGHSSPWTKENDASNSQTEVDDNHPPTPKNTDSIKEILGYKRVTSKFLVIHDDEAGTIIYKNQKWRIVESSKALEQGARWVYLTTYVEYNNLPINVSYRQIGVSTGVESSEVNDSLLPNEITNPGILEALDNRTPIYRNADQRERLSIIIEF